MLGLDAAGKTSQLGQLVLAYLTDLHVPPAILYKLKLNQSVTTIPTGASSLFLSNQVLDVPNSSWLQRGNGDL